MNLRQRLDAVEAAVFRSMSDTELDAIIGSADLSAFTDAELEMLANGTAPAELVQRFVDVCV